MISHPSAEELLDGVIRFIELHAAPKLEDRDAFLARVAVNALNTVKRELQFSVEGDIAARNRLKALLGQEGDLESLNRALCAALQGGTLTLESAGVLEHLKASALHQIQIDQPNYSGIKALQD